MNAHADIVREQEELDALLADQSQWPVVRSLILSEQIGADRVVHIALNNKDFIEWYLNGE